MVFGNSFETADNQLFKVIQRPDDFIHEMSLPKRLLSRTSDLEIITLSFHNVNIAFTSNLLSANVVLPRLSPLVKVIQFKFCHYSSVL
jgi:hypothetical protein